MDCLSGTVFRLCCFLIITNLANLAHAAITPPPSWTHETTQPYYQYRSLNSNYFDTPKEACAHSMPPTYVSGGNTYITYSSPKALVGGWCNYWVTWKQFGKVKYESSVDAQNWYSTWISCPPGFRFSSSEKLCKRLRPAREETCPKGDPIYTGRGYNYQLQTDYTVHPSSGSRLRFARQYASWHMTSHNGPLGPSWFIETYGRYLTFTTEDGNPYVHAVRALGTMTLFGEDATGWVSEATNSDRLERLPTASAPAAWKYHDSTTDNAEYYDAAGRLLSIVERTGATYTLTYSNAVTSSVIASHPGLLIAVTDPYGRQLQLRYDRQARLIQLMDPNGEEYTYAYDEDADDDNPPNSRLTSVTYPDGQVRRYHYEQDLGPKGTFSRAELQRNIGGVRSTASNFFPDGSKNEVDLVAENAYQPLTGITDENGERFATFRYDMYGRVLVAEHAGGAERHTFSYDYPLFETTVTDPLGTERTYRFRKIGDTLKEIGVSQPCTSGCDSAQAMAYDYRGNLTSRTDFKGIATRYGYDRNRNLETVRVEGYYSSQNRTFETAWHPTWRLPVTQSGPNRRITYRYDGDEGVSCGATGVLCEKIEQAIASPTGKYGLTARTVGEPRVWRYTYNTDGRLLSVDGPRTDVNDITRFGYDVQGNLISVTNALGHVTRITAHDASGRPLTIIDPNGVTTELHYDPRGRLLSQDLNGAVTTFDYDGAGNLVTLHLPEGGVLTYTYDAAHRLIGIEDALGNTIEYTLNPAGHRIHTDVYDPQGSLVRTHERTYDRLSRLHSHQDGEGELGRYGYDANDNLTTVTDATGEITQYAYDGLNRLMEAIDPLDGIVTYAYDGQDQVTQVTDQNGATTTYNYDGLGNRLSQDSPDTGLTTYTYDKAGNRLSQTDAAGITTRYRYDALNRVTAIEYPDSTLNVTFSYDAGSHGIGRLTGMRDGTGETAYQYDGFGHLITETRTQDGHTTTVGYQYDTAGQLVGVTLPSGHEVAYARNTLGQVERVSLSGQNMFFQVADTIEYYPFGPLEALTYANGLTLSRTLDGRYRLVEQNLSDYPARTLAYDALGNITTLRNGVYKEAFAYDALGRLVRADGPYGWLRYDYDPLGNRLALEDNGTFIPSTYDTAGHRLLAVGDTPLSYDANGNTVAKGTTQFVYGDHNRLVSTYDSSFSATYGYDGQGQRVKKTVSGERRYFHYAQHGQLLAESDAAGRPVREYIYLNGVALALLDHQAVTTLSFVHPDHRGAPQRVTNMAGETVWTANWRPFGETIGSASLSQPLRFPGQYADAETGLYYNYFRDYDPATGRYLQSDPIGLAGGLNTYRYVGNNPVNFIDPYGLFSLPSLPQWVVDGSAGFGDALSFGATDWIRDEMGTNDAVDKCSSSYSGGKYAGYGLGAGLGAAGGARALGWSVNINKYKHGGGGVNLLKNGDRKFGADWHKFKHKGITASRPHYHRGKTKSQMKKHRPWQGGW
jgi:RHS repeat-associated protein